MSVLFEGKLSIMSIKGLFGQMVDLKPIILAQMWADLASYHPYLLFIGLNGNETILCKKNSSQTVTQ